MFAIRLSATDRPRCALDAGTRATAHWRGFAVAASSALREPVQRVRDPPVVPGELGVVGGQVVHMLLQLLDLPAQGRHLPGQTTDLLGGTPLLPLVLRGQRLQGLA